MIYVAPAVTRIGSETVPTTELGARFALQDDLDLGVKVFPVGLGVDVNYVIAQIDERPVSINPALTYFVFGVDGASIGGDEDDSLSATFGTAYVNVLTDLYSHPRLTITAGLKPGVMFAGAPSEIFGRRERGVSLFPGADAWCPDRTRGVVLHHADRRRRRPTPRREPLLAAVDRVRVVNPWRRGDAIVWKEVQKIPESFQ